MTKTSNEALALWRKVASGERSEEIDEWLRETAQHIVDDVFLAKFKEGSYKRPQKALATLGFRGRLDPSMKKDALTFRETTPTQFAKIADLIYEDADDTERVRKFVENTRRNNPK